MNKLWIRLSLAFAGVVIAVSIVASIAARLSIEASIGSAAEMPPEARAYFQQVRSENPYGPVAMIGIVGTVAIVAGIWMSRTLTKPMQELGEAAQAIGHQDLSRRVSVKGTAEIQYLADRFNEMAQQLEDAEKLRSNLLADVAHELRNPLHVLRGNLQAILDDVYPLTKEEVARLVDQTRYLTALVDDLHELAQAEAHQLPLYKKETDMADLVKETTVAFKPIAAGKEIDLQVELLGSIPHLDVDPDRMRQVLTNLLANAFRHTPNGGCILVSVEEVDEMLSIRVHDNGAGISEADLPRVFDRFYRSDPARSRDTGGSGLGLAIVEAIVIEHNGHITAESPGLGQGSTFTILLPPVS